MAFLDTLRNLLPNGGRNDKPRPNARFMEGEKGTVWAKWWPMLREPREDVGEAYDRAQARAVDMAQNVGWIAGGIEASAASVVGGGLRLQAKPKYQSLGMDETTAKQWAKDVEALWHSYACSANECDAEGRSDHGKQQRQAYMSFIATGEIVAELPYINAANSLNKSKVRVIPPMRMSRETNLLDNVVQGVQLNTHGRPMAYRFKYTNHFGQYRDLMVPARDRYNRLRLLHVFDGMAGQVRGISPLTPALRVAKRFDQLANATLTANILRSVFAATLTSEYPTNEAMQGLLTHKEQAQVSSAGDSVSAFDCWNAAQQGWYEGAQIDIGTAGRIAHLFPGQKLDLMTVKGAAGEYETYAKMLLREIARCLGITYEDFTGDYAGVTFSSIRMAVHQIWAIVMERRRNVLSPFNNGCYENWLEEQIETGRVMLPGGMEQFMSERAGICYAEWKGTPRPQADDEKMAKAVKILNEIGALSLTQLCDDLGYDYEDTVAYLAAEKELREELGIELAAETAATLAREKISSDEAKKQEAEEGRSSEEY